MSQHTKISRRRFLTSATAAAALPMIVPSSVFGANAPSERIELAGIGMGGRGVGNMKNLMNQKGVQVVATCDADLLKAQSFARYAEGKQGQKGVKVYQDYRELLAKTSCDAVMIGTPDHLHAVIGIACANAGKDIYGEKPFARYIKEGRALVNAVERNGVIWQTGSWQRSKKSFRHACELVRNGHMGKITKITIGLPAGWGSYDKYKAPIKPQAVPKTLDYDLWLGPAPWSPYYKEKVTYSWRLISDYGGGKLLDWIGHHGDIAQWGLGRDNSGPCKCTPGKITYPTHGLFDTPIQYKYTLEYDDGIEVEIGDDKQVPKGCRFWNDKGEWLEVSRSDLTASNKALLKTVIGPGETRLYHSSDHEANWTSCIRSRKQTITPAETAHRSVTLGHLCLIAERLGRTVNFDPKTESFLKDPAAQALTQRAYRAGWELPL
ncbi:MAG: Gfo/Idh/MocA family oxidoreductase [Phycisphaerales bacterium]|nr:Gfo/Idh/MocA family oxidoreductase [Phycisphaerales bacterium]MBT7171256.1 Gfo/Idh/MocA family oxidoreductase [Phycisphaerales bacterium]